MERELVEKALRLVDALEAGAANTAREMLRGEDALELVLLLAKAPQGSDVRRTVGDLLDILAAERAATKAFAQATGGAKPPTPHP